MEKKTTLTFAISQEEALVILAYLGVKELMGLDMSVFADLSDEQRILLLGVAERALYPRGFLVTAPDGQLQLAEAVNSLVRACTNPDASLVMRSSYPERPAEEFYFHRARKLSVLHTIPLTAIHQFMAVENRGALARAALSTLNIAGLPELSCPGGKLSQAALDAARQTALEQGEAAAVEALTDAGLPRATAQVLAKTLAGGGLNHSVLFAHHEGGKNVRLEGFALIGGPDGVWMLKPLDEPSGQVEVRPTGAAEIGQLLKDWIA